MASIKDLKVSWNFDNLETSDIAGNVVVSDVSNDNTGFGQNFGSSDGSFITKEYIKTFTKRQIDSLENYDTIRVLEEDDDRINDIQKPSSMQLILEKSMYQIISDEMLNMFSNNQAYAAKYLQPFNKFTEEYPLLEESKKDFFSKINENPNLEKFLEFYKWLDSSLGYMLDQLKPESVNNINGLKNTVESHILERNKYKHQIPLTIEPNRVFSTNIPGTTGKSAIGTIEQYTIKTKNDTLEQVGTLKNNPELSDVIDHLYVIENTKNINYTKNYEFFQTAGRILNPRVGKEANKSVFRTSFSSVDGVSDIKKDDVGEYSVNNSSLFKHYGVKQQLNAIYSSTGSNTQGDINESFNDNGYISRNIPYTASSYTTNGAIDASQLPYQIFPRQDILLERQQNRLADLLLQTPDISQQTYENSFDTTEPPIQFCSPLHHKLKTKNGTSDIEILSPYNSAIDTFSRRNETRFSEKLNSIFSHTIKNHENPAKNTFFEQLSNTSSGSVDINSLELLNIVYPRTDLIGLAAIRLKDNYEEEVSAKNTDYKNSLNQNNSDEYTRELPWSYKKSFNNHTHLIKSFWRSEEKERRRTRGTDYLNVEGSSSSDRLDNVGSYNCYGYGNAKNNLITESFCQYDPNIYNSMYTMDSNVPLQYVSGANGMILSSSAETYGDLAPYSHFQQAILISLKNQGISVQPKPEFVHNLFLNDSLDAYVFNKSYQVGLNCNIKPFYNSYDEFRQNIKNKSQSYSIVPEFIVSNFPKLIKDGKDNYTTGSSGTSIPLYLTLKGKEYRPDIYRENFKFDFNKFIDKKSNKIKIKLKAIKKILPYNGFYPQQRSMEIAGIFNDVYLRDTEFVKDRNKIYNNDIGYVDGVKSTLAATQAFFAPGILFNTIKSGIAVNWIIPKDISSAKTGSDNFYVDIKDGKKIKFESILDPSALSSSVSSLIYINPTHYSKQILNKLNLSLPSDDYDQKYQFGTKNFVSEQQIYKSSINNFFSEIINFFLKDKKLTSFKSPMKADETIPVVPGYTYYMDIVITKKQNFSMFDNIIPSQYKNFALIPSASLFGPPTSQNHKSFKSYYPFLPPYYRDNHESVLRVSYTVPTGTSSIKISDIIEHLDISDKDVDSEAVYNDSFGNRISLSDCLNIGKTTDGSFIIETKLETPLINFNGCYQITNNKF